MHVSQSVAAPSMSSGARLLLAVGTLVAGTACVLVANPFAPLVASPTQSLPENCLLDFTAKWCGPCQQMSPIIARLEEQGYPIRRIDVDAEPDLARQYRPAGLPTFVLVVSGQEAMRITGKTSEAQLKRMLLQIPQRQQELAETPKPQPAPKRLADRGDEFAPSPFNVAEEPRREASEQQVAENTTPKKNRFGFNLFNRPEKPQPAPRSTEPPVVRGQSRDADRQPGRILAVDPMSASTRLRVKDAKGLNYGSGTIIDSRTGRTLVLTCAHIFRELQDSSIIEVEVFDADHKPVIYIGKVLSIDAAADVAVVLIPTDQALPAVPVSVLTKAVTAGDKVMSIGCGGGDLPSKQAHQVTALNKYDGPANIECTGMPVQGRSGGGLFRDAELIGVCILADPEDQRGVYTGLAPIHELLKQANSTTGAPAETPSAEPEVGIAKAVPASATPVSKSVAPRTESAAATPLPVELGALNAPTEILRDALSATPDAEIICIVRPKQAGVASKVVVIHQASPKLVHYLLDDGPVAGGVNAIADRATEALIPTSQMSPATESTEPRRPRSPRSAR